MPWGIIVAGIIGAGATAYASSQSPDAPDYGRATREGIEADMETLPMRRRIEAAARMGQKLIVPGPMQPIYETREVTQDRLTGKWVDSTGKVWNGRTEMRNGKHYAQVQVGQRPTQKVYDFTGAGDADYQAKMATRMAAETLKLQKKYGAAFVKQRLKELQLADPEGFASRKQMYHMIQDQIAKAPDTSMNQKVSDEIMAELSQGGQLSEDVRREVEQSVRRGQAARGNTRGNAAMFAEAMEVGSAAEKRRSDRLARAQSWLTSGATKDDVEFRRFQQNLGNLGAYVEGRTPTSQFGQLSGAQQGAAPFMMSNQSLPGLDPNAGSVAASYGLQRHAQQGNPWLQGMAGGMAGANVWANYQAGRR